MDLSPSPYGASAPASTVAARRGAAVFYSTWPGRPPCRRTDPILGAGGVSGRPAPDAARHPRQQATAEVRRQILLRLLSPYQVVRFFSLRRVAIMLRRSSCNPDKKRNRNLTSTQILAVPVLQKSWTCRRTRSASRAASARWSCSRSS